MFGEFLAYDLIEWACNNAAIEVLNLDGVMWVFARSTKNWMKVPENDIWNVVYPNYSGYWDYLFKDLPEPPIPA